MPPRLSRRAFLLASSVAATSLAVGCTAPARQQDERGQQGQPDVDEITWALPALGTSLFVPREWSTYTGAMVSLVQEGLLTFADDLSLTTAVADSWEQVDATTFRYVLRPGVTFGDGSPLTTDDVVASFRYQMDPAAGSQLAAFFSSVASVEAADERTINVTLTTPNVQFRYTPGHMAGFIFKKSQLDGAGDTLGTPENLPLGTGPYRLVEFVPGNRVVVEARDDYWGTRPVARRIIFREIPDRQTCVLAMQNSDIDGAFDLALSDIEQWQSLGNAEVVTSPSLGMAILSLDQSTPPFDDIHVRRAIAHCVDRHGLVTALLNGHGEPATTLDPPEIWVGVLSADEARAFYATIPQYEFDLDKARAELAASAHPEGFAVTVPGSTADPYQIDILQSVAANLRQIGIVMTVQEKDANQWLADYFRHENLSMQIMTYMPDFADPGNYPALFLSSANATADGLNASNFRNADVDAALSTANSQTDPSVRAEALKQVFRIANEQVAYVPIFWPASAMAISTEYSLNSYNALWYNVPWAVRGFGVR
jgi:peptide/nickel transport system substrate-binding protein